MELHECMNSEMDEDFLKYLDRDACLKIFLFLDDHADLVRASCVSRSWRHFVIENTLCKNLCWKLIPASKQVEQVLDLTLHERIPPLEIEHRAYAFFLRGCVSFPLSGLIEDAISASSTDNYPEESVRNTLEFSERVARRASYWSSKGHIDPSSSEILVYELVSKICVITEINIKPFQAYFQWGSPIYAPKSVRFRLGNLKNSDVDSLLEPCDNLPDENFSWTYTSPVFPMLQDNILQKFKLPEPVLCLGGHLQIELMGRVQRQVMDGLFYTCICYAEAIGRSLSPPFGIESVEETDKFVLKVRSYNEPSEDEMPRQTRMYPGEERHLELIANMLQNRDNLEGIVFVNGEDDINDPFLD